MLKGTKENETTNLLLSELRNLLLLFIQFGSEIVQILFGVLCSRFRRIDLFPKRSHVLLQGFELTIKILEFLDDLLHRVLIVFDRRFQFRRILLGLHLGHFSFRDFIVRQADVQPDAVNFRFLRQEFGATDF